MRRSVGKSHEQLFRENLVLEIRHFVALCCDGANDEELAEQRGVIRGCAMQLTSWCSYMHHRNRLAVAAVMQAVVREVLEEMGQAQFRTSIEGVVVGSAS